MNAATTIYLYGTQTDLAGASAIIEAVRQGGIEAAVVSTWDGVRSDVAAANDLTATRRGWLARGDADVRWRREGNRLLVTVVAEAAISGLDMEQHEVAEVHAGPRTRSRWPSDGIEVQPRRLTYVDRHGIVLAARDEPTRTDRES